MFKKIIAVCLLFCLLAVNASAASFNPYRISQSSRPSIPSFPTYMGKYATAGKVTTEDYLIYEKYSGKPSNIAPLAESYVHMLVETFQFDIIDERWADFGNYARITYSLTLDTSKELSTFSVNNSDNEPEWKTPYVNVVVQYTIPDSGTSYIHLYYSPELRVVTHTETYAPPGKKQTNPTAKPTKTPKPSVDTESSASYY